MFSLKLVVTLVICSLITGGVLGFYFTTLKQKPTLNQNGGYKKTNDAGSSLEIRQNKKFGFTNPLLECASDQNTSPAEFSSMEDKLNRYIDQSKSQKTVSDIAIYFRDLNNGPWIGINEKTNFTPSSLLKLPILITFLKHAEDNPSLLSKKIVYTQTPDINQNYKPAKVLETNKSYTIEELLEQMIIYSDNEAKNLLLTNIETQDLNQIYIDLGIILPPQVVTDDYMNVKEYSSLFRVLFNASYLSKSMSEKALQLLSRADFKLGLRAGVPSEIKIAHKFGERTLEDGVSQLHDCGIIYLPDNPYLLCIMTRGKQAEGLPKIISDISQIVYQSVSESQQK